MSRFIGMYYLARHFNQPGQRDSGRDAIAGRVQARRRDLKWRRDVLLVVLIMAIPLTLLATLTWIFRG